MPPIVKRNQLLVIKKTFHTSNKVANLKAFTFVSEWHTVPENIMETNVIAYEFINFGETWAIINGVPITPAIYNITGGFTFFQSYKPPINNGEADSTIYRVEFKDTIL